MSGFVQQNDRNKAIAQTVDQVAQQAGCSSAQVALNWLRQQEVIPIIGARKLSQIKLSPEQVETLNSVSAIELGFPHDFLKQDMVRQLVYGGMADAIDNHRLAQMV